MPELFEPLRIREMELKNRIVFAPIITYFGLRNERALHYYRERARGGAALIMLHATPVDVLQKTGWTEGLAPVVKAVHDAGAKIGVQMWHGNDFNGHAIAPSERDNFREITRDEIAEVIRKFSRAATNCQKVGFDAVEVHGAHGYFVNQFFSPLTNRRTDEYGGSLDGRMLFGMELMVALRKAADVVLMYRHSAVDGPAGGTTIEESVKFARALENHWVDVIDVSAGAGHGNDLSIPPVSAAEGTHAELAARIKQRVGIPVIAVGRVQTRMTAEKILQEGKADLVALGRQLLADPYWPEKIREGREGEIVSCSYCNLCTTEMKAGRPILCCQNPALGKEGVTD